MLESQEHHNAALTRIVRFIGILFFIVSLYYIAYIAAGPLFPFQPAYLRSVPLPIMTTPLPQLLVDIAWRGIPLTCLAIGLVCFVGSFQRPVVTYWCLQIAVWLIGISLWYHFNSYFSPWPPNPTWIIITALCSIILFVFRKQVKRYIWS